MSLVLYLYSAPKYQNTTAEEIKLIESYLEWQHEKSNNGKYSCDTFEQWCSHSESELPSKDVIEYYQQFWIKKKMRIEMLGDMDVYSIFNQLGRFCKTNHIINWFYKNVMNGELDKNFHEVSKEQICSLYHICKKIRDTGIELIEKNKHGIDALNKYDVDESVTNLLPPLYGNKGMFFGSTECDSFYAYQIIRAVDILKNIINTTDFDKQVIYLKPIW